MRFCQDCINYHSCKKQGMDIPDHIVEKHKRDVIHILCHDFQDKQTHGRWLKDKPLSISMECSVCHRCYVVANHNFCPNCGAKMDLPNITDQAQAALSKMGAAAHGEE